MWWKDERLKMIDLARVRPSSKVAMQTDTDDDRLIADVADGNHDAFAAIYERYNDAAFNLALYLTGNRAVAEEAVQEAMLRIWTSAKSYQPGNARAWILRIVAREGIRLGKASKRTKLESEERMKERTDMKPVAEDPAQAELMSALRAVMQELPASDQQLVALHYGAGLSLREMSAVLTVPRQTLHFQVNKALGTLKSKLAAAGFAAMVPLLTESNIGQALVSGAKCPSGLREAVLHKVGNAKAMAEWARQAQSASRRIVPLKSGSSAVYVFIVIALTAGAGTWWAFHGSKTTATQLSAPSLPPTPSRIDRTWSFEKGPADDLSLKQGEWTWQFSREKNSGCMVPSGATPTGIVFPLKFPHHPMTIRFQCFMDEEGSWSTSLLPMVDNLSVAHDYYSADISRTMENLSQLIRTRVVTIEMIGRYYILSMDEVPFAVHEFPTDYPSECVTLLIEGWHILNISVHQQSENEIPAQFRDIPSIIKRMKTGPIRLDRNNVEVTGKTKK